MMQICHRNCRCQVNQVVVDSFLNSLTPCWCIQTQISFIIQEPFSVIGNPYCSFFRDGDITPVHWISLPIDRGTAERVASHQISNDNSLERAWTRTHFSLFDNHRGANWGGFDWCVLGDFRFWAGPSRPRSRSTGASWATGTSRSTSTTTSSCFW